ncbi:hypothetical protein Syun_015565 [Stephania yunnanensis]|uniref:DYW domain-containing protein n=1 Tax=Stephania yunnanensis TaxID=152371 RepID=A0AAP0JM93_9MAGN
MALVNLHLTCFVEVDPSDDSAYVLLSNICAVNGRWEDVNHIRTQMKSIKLKKKPGCSWVKVNNKVSTFGIGDNSHPQSIQIYTKLKDLMNMIRQSGYVPDTTFALHDTDEEQKEHNLWNHSEKLALAFALLNTPKGSKIKVFKNLRVCGDCHSVYKYVSVAVDREIVLRDPYRFRHFREGKRKRGTLWDHALAGFELGFGPGVPGHADFVQAFRVVGLGEFGHRDAGLGGDGVMRRRRTGWDWEMLSSRGLGVERGVGDRMVGGWNGDRLNA